MRRTLQLGSLVLALGAWSLAAGAAAQETSPEASEQVAEPSEVRDADREAYLLHFERGLELAERDLWGEALVEFEHARAAVETARALQNIVLSLERLGRYREGLTTLARWTEVTEEGSGDRQQIATWMSDLRGRLGHLALQVEPVEAVVLVGGVVRDGEGEMRDIELDPGRHNIEVRAPGRSSERFEVEVDPGQRITRAVELVEPGPPAPVAVMATPEDERAGPSTRAVLAAPAAGGGVEPAAGVVTLAVGGAVLVAGGLLIGLGADDFFTVSNAVAPTPWLDVADAHDRAPALLGAGSALAAVGLGAVLVGAVLLSLGSSDEATVAVGPSRIELSGRF